ncbi:YaeQ family protein [Endozoicomonas sp. Mp262]|uniref:YaeQ family protein n=1 Tax=Endozoicomonas sp. Mp262 TaxID=2919499 RepID=UPI0021D81356
MALKATILKAELHIADMERHYYNSHNLTIARHPSENDERMMLRILVFALHADEHLTFTKGISTDDEPDIWRKNLSGEIELWIELGQPDEKRIRRACGRAKQVLIYNYGGRQADIWWQQSQTSLKRFRNLTVVNIPYQASSQLRDMAAKAMQLQCTIQDGQVLMTDDQHSIDIELEKRELM